MNDDTLRDVDAQRARWRRFRAAQGLDPVSDGEFARGGLALRVAELDIRMLFLAHDPEADRVPCDADTVAWIREARPSPWDGQQIPLGSREGAANDTVAIYDSWRDDGSWAHYLAMHRHGGLELATRCAYSIRETRVFPLVQTVGYAWALAARQVDAIEKWNVSPPYEFCLALRSTRGAILGSFAEGWREPHESFRDFEGAAEEHILIRREFAELPEPEAFAIDLGGRIENAFGTTHRRHLANSGDYAGRFDPGFRFQ